MTSSDRVAARDSAPSAVSFRDPAGRVFIVDRRILRGVRPEAADVLRAFAASPIHEGLRERIIGFDEIEAPEIRECGVSSTEAAEFSTWLEHPRMEFPSYPPEWSPEMLHAAGRLTVDIADGLLDGGFGLKDATPFNVLFDGPRPVLTDVLSIERRDPADPIWIPYAQFGRTFLLPLMAMRHFGLSSRAVFGADPAGLTPDQIHRMAGPLRRLSPPFLAHSTIPRWLDRVGRRAGERPYAGRRVDPRRAKFTLRHLFKGLRRSLDRVGPRTGRRSEWSEYDDPIGGRYVEAKLEAVRRQIEGWRPTRVLDLGCNTGRFSELAARAGAAVVAVDADPVAVGRLYRHASANYLDILPLVVDLRNPTPPLGWRNAETRGFVDRARGSFDVVLALALTHHLRSDGLPLAEVLDLIASLTRDRAIIEHVHDDDPMFRRLQRGREIREVAPFDDLCRRSFSIEKKESMPGGTRTLYTLRRA